MHLVVCAEPALPCPALPLSVPALPRSPRATCPAAGPLALGRRLLGGWPRARSGVVPALSGPAAALAGPLLGGGGAAGGAGRQPAPRGPPAGRHPGGRRPRGLDLQREPRLLLGLYVPELPVHPLLPKLSAAWLPGSRSLVGLGVSPGKPGVMTGRPESVPPAGCPPGPRCATAGPTAAWAGSPGCSAPTRPARGG